MAWKREEYLKLIHADELVLAEHLWADHIQNATLIWLCIPRRTCVQRGLWAGKEV